MDAEINCQFIDYFRSGHCAYRIESNTISIHIPSGDIIVDGSNTDESIYKFLALQLDENKKLFISILR